MHLNLSGALGIGIPVLLGTALAAGASALPAQAQTWQDTALSAGQVQDATFGGVASAPADGKGVIDLSGTAVTWSLHGVPPLGVTLANGVITYSGTPVASPAEIVADATDAAGNAEAYEISVTLGAGTIQLNGKPVKVSLSSLDASNVAGTVKFSAVSSATADTSTITFAESSLPTGLTSGSPVLTYVGGTAAPSTYGGVQVAATDALGAVLHGQFSLTVYANQVSNYGDAVNRYGNGFDAYQQHDYAGAVIAGWTATQADPATHFILNPGRHAGAYQFEYAPRGSGSGLCVSDPGGGWRSDPLRDGLILTPCNTGPWQQFMPQSNGTLKNLATGLYVNPDGTGAQLRGGTSATSWGGSYYHWKGYSSLPA